MADPITLAIVGNFVLNAAIGVAVSAGVNFVSQQLIGGSENGGSNPAGSPIQPRETAVDGHVNALSVGSVQNGPQIGIFGHRRVGGRVLLSAKDDDYTYIIIAIAGATVDRINGVYVDDVLVNLDAAGDVANNPWTLNTLSSLNIALYTGPQTVADSVLTAKFPGYSPAVGQKMAYARIRIRQRKEPEFANVYNGGVPDFTFDVQGFRCYDPRQGAHNIANPATWSYSSNSAIIQANYLIHELGMGLPVTAVDWASVTAAANICDQMVYTAGSGTYQERRYQCSAVWLTDESHESVIRKIAATHAGGMIPPGLKYRIVSGTGGTATDDFEPNSYAGSGIAWAETDSLSERVNGVRGLFTHPGYANEARDFPPVQNAAAITADGQEKWLDLPLDYCPSQAQAQRLANVALVNARDGFDAQVTTNLSRFNTIAGDLVTLTDSLAGFVAKPFRVVRERMLADMTLTFDMRHEPADLYTRWNYATQERAALQPLPLQPEPVGLLPPGGVIIDAGSSAMNVIPEVFFWPSYSSGADTYRVQLHTSGGVLAAEWAGAIGSIGGNSSHGIGFLVTDPCHRIRVRAENSTNGTVSSWRVLIDAGATTYAPFNGVVASNSPALELPQPRRLDLRYYGGGSAKIAFTQALYGSVTELRLYMAGTNGFSFANQVGLYANNSALYQYETELIPGAPRYFWLTHSRANGDHETLPSRPILVTA